jgi:hypothetical protein
LHRTHAGLPFRRRSMKATHAIPSSDTRALPSWAEHVREDLQHGHSEDLGRRRALIGCSLVAVASMTAVFLLQTGMVKHLPDPPVPGSIPTG